MRFADIPGLRDTSHLLAETVKNSHAAHAQLFLGSPGALNLPMALAYATYLHCENKGDDACGVCAACSKSLKYIHPDTHFVFPVSNVKGDKDEDRFKAEIMKSWRAFLLENPFGSMDDWTNYYGGEDKQAIISKDESREIIKALALKPFESRSKIMIIWQPELMHPSAANAILKILEEPPPQTFFILVTNAGDQLLPTILSRTQIVTIPLLSDEDLLAYLKSRGVEPARASKITTLADGNLNHALRLAEGSDDNHSQFFIEWMRTCFRHDYISLVRFADEYHGMDKLQQKNLMAVGMNLLREALLNNAGAHTIHRVTGDELAFVQNFAKALDLKKIDQAYRLFNDAGYFLERNGSAKMIFLDLSLQLANLFKPQLQTAGAH
jgi:DNA polymerase-3 subunit delta'